MTFLELAKAVRQECGIQGTGPASVTDQLGLLKKVADWTSNADLMVQSLHTDWKFLWKQYTATTTLGYAADTTLGSASLTKPSDLGMWDRTSFGIARGTATGRPIKVVPYEEWRSNFSLKTNAEPYSLCILPNDNLSLSAPANATYSISADYWQEPTIMAANTSTPLYPVRYQRVIIARAKMWYFEYVESTDQWKQAKEEYEKYLDNLEGFALPGQQQATQSSPELMAVRSA